MMKILYSSGIILGVAGMAMNIKDNTSAALFAGAFALAEIALLIKEI